MKKILLIACIALCIIAKAQIKEGRIVYARVTQTPARLFNNPDIAAQLPKSRTDQFELLFSSTQSLWQYLPTNGGDDANTFSGGSNGANVMFRFAGGSNEVTYHNFEKGTVVNQREVMDVNFLVTDSIQKLNWKLTNETKTILNYSVREAISQRIGTRQQIMMENGTMKRVDVADTSNIIAWFTTDISVPAGPATYQGQLPGAILELNVNKGQTVFQAIEFSPKVNVNKIKEPKDGKKVTTTEFSKQRDQLMEQMRKNLPPGTNIRMN